MLASHLILLIRTFCTITKPEEYTRIETENIEIATEDIHKGKIVARTKNDEGELYYKNIRPILNQLSMPEMQHYEIGLGSATTRTLTQQKLANKHTKTIVEQAYDNVIFVDGSINSKDNPNHYKFAQEVFGGCGGILITKQENEQRPHTYFREKINTNDPQLAELEGILKALQLAEYTNNITNKNEFSILCDCKGAVRCINHQYSIPYHYSRTCQKIQEERTKLTKKEIKHEITWITGHTKYRWNEKADKLAKEAANSWVPSYKPPSFRSLNGYAIRHFSQDWDTD